MPQSTLADWSQSVLRFWFEELTEKQWWESTPEQDENIRTRFLGVYQAVSATDPDELTTTPQTSLAAVIVLDQFPRNMFRRTAAAFATDPKALQITDLALAKGHDLQLAESQRHFLYMPLMHAEDMAAQMRALAIFTGPAMTGPGREETERAVRDHLQIIQQFGRFPHRNAVLGRPNTPAEDAYLSGDAKRFGQ